MKYAMAFRPDGLVDLTVVQGANRATITLTRKEADRIGRSLVEHRPGDGSNALVFDLDAPLIHCGRLDAEGATSPQF